MIRDTIPSPGVSRVARTLQERIETGDYSPGQWLPAERELADELGVHRRTIRGAITHLAQEGRLVCRPRCRPMVASPSRPMLASPPAPVVASPPAPVVASPPAPVPPGAAVSPEAAGSRLVALIMWHGGFEPRASAQQRIFWGFNRALSGAGYHGVFLDLGERIESEEENGIREAARLQYALDHRFAGVAFYPYAYRRNRGLIREAARRTPLVLIDRQIPGVEADYVGIDNLSAMEAAARHLVALGHARIALVTRSEPINTVQDRIAGYRAALRSSVPPLPDQVITVDSALEWSMFDLILRQPPGERPSALICVNDFIALQVAERLTGLGLSVPGDVALVGFDDLVQTLPSGAGLTSVAQPFEEIGAAAARLVLERIADPTMAARHVELTAPLVCRADSPSRAGRPAGAAPAPRAAGVECR